MQRSTLPHARQAAAMAIAAELIAARRLRHGDLRMEGTDGGDGGGSGGGDGGGSDGSGGGAGGDSGETDGSDKGFPENTAVAEMTDKQAAAYWKYQSRKHEDTAKKRGDYDSIRAKAEELDRIKAEQMTPSDKALKEAEDRGRAAAAAAANEDQVKNLLRVALGARGKEGDDLEELVVYANPTAFITDGKVDTAKVTAYAAKVAVTSGGGGGGGGGGRPDLGQGRREGGGKPSVASGRDLFAERNKSRQTAGA